MSQLAVNSEQLPVGWKVKTLDDLCEIARGGSPRPIKQFLTDAPDGVNWIKIGDATASSKYIYETKEKIKPEGVKRSRLVKEGDFLLSNSMSFGRPYIMKTSGCIHDGGLVLRDKSGNLDQDYLYHFLGSSAAYRQFDNLAAGSTVRNLNIDLVRHVKVTLPPLPEQKRIVAILDKVLAGITQAASNAEKNLSNAREMFKSVLQAAIEGKLLPEASLDGVVEDQLKKPKIKPLPAITDEEIPFSLPTSWQWQRLGSIAKFINGDRGKNYPKKKEYVSSGIPWINTGHIQPDGSLSIESMNYITKEKFDTLRSGKIKEGDLIYCLRGATIGKTAFVAPYAKGGVASSLVIIRPKSSINRKYLYYFLTSSFGQRLIKRFDNGAAQPNLGANSVMKYVTPLPPLFEQRVIVKKLDALSYKTQALETIFQQKLTALAELKQSILQKAFKGELTAKAA